MVAASGRSGGVGVSDGHMQTFIVHAAHLQSGLLVSSTTAERATPRASSAVLSSKPLVKEDIALWPPGSRYY